jgi:DNA ligase 1
VQTIGTATKTSDKLQALINYFQQAPDQDKVWVIALFSGRRPKRAVSAALLSEWCREINNLPAWLFEECYHTVGDLAETIALLLPAPDKALSTNSLTYYIEQLITLGTAPVEEKKAFVTESWQTLPNAGRFVFNKLITGGFRIGVSQQLIVQALAKNRQLETSQIAHLISGLWDPSLISFNQLLNEENKTQDFSKPYPFFLAHAVESEQADLGLGAANLWQAEWKWDGIRGQLIKRNNELFVWSRGEELMTSKFPEYQALLNLLPNGIALDGEIMPSRDGQPLPFAILQTRIGRKTVSKKQLLEAPVAFFAYDLLEWENTDWRGFPLTERRAQLEKIIQSIGHPSLLLSPGLSFDSWQALKEIRVGSRNKGAEGLMLKRKSSAYQVGRKRGDWWKWKIDPLTIDAVLIYAQKGHGRRSNLYTDYTFAVRDGEKLVPFTKAYSGLTDKEFAQVDAFVKNNAIEKFGPVRTVKPQLVFEIAFEGIAASKRHKSGVALRFPRMLKWRTDKQLADINTLDELKLMLLQYGKHEQ